MIFNVNTVADGSADVQSVWVLYTGKAGSSYHGNWAPLDLTQSTDDRSRWEGALTLQSGANAQDLLFMVQAVGGAGLTTLATNLGAYYTVTPENATQLPPPAATVISLQSPPATGTYLQNSTFNVLLTSLGQPVSGQFVTLDVGGQQALGLTDASGFATLTLKPVIVPGDYTVQASFPGNAGYFASTDSSEFKVNKDSTTVSLTPSSATILADQPTPFVAAVRDSSGRALGGRSVIFVIHDGVNSFTRSVIADYQGNATLGVVQIPTGVYTVDVYFNGTIPVNPSNPLNLTDDYYQSSNILGSSLTIVSDTTPPTITASATKADSTPYSTGEWSNQDVTVRFTCDDTESGVASCPADQAFNTDGEFTASGTATDNVGNTATTSIEPIKIDKSLPTISVTATTADTTPYIAGEWTNQTVTISFTCETQEAASNPAPLTRFTAATASSQPKVQR